MENIIMKTSSFLSSVLLFLLLPRFSLGVPIEIIVNGKVLGTVLGNGTRSLACGILLY